MSGAASLDLRPPQEVRRIARRLEESGYQAWAVGGAVRDALAGLDAEDWDLTTSARPSDVQRIFRRTVPIGVDHGTVGVLGKDGELYEVTTFRRDVEAFGRRARVAFSDTLEEDLERRDFTINAVAWHPLSGELRDPHGGAEDLRHGVLRTVGDAGSRFTEDRLRVLRALRFAGRFGLRIDPATWDALRESADRLDNLSAERIRDELYKVLAGDPDPARALELYRESGVLGELFPELQACVGLAHHSGEDVWTHQLRVLVALPRTRPILRLAALLHDVGTVSAADTLPPWERAAAGAASAREVMRRLRSSNADADRVAHLIAQHPRFPSSEAAPAEVRRWLRRVGTDYCRDLIRLRIAHVRAGAGGDPGELRDTAARIRAMLRERVPLAASDLAIGGAELRKLGIPAGPLYGEILRDLLELVTDDPSLNERERLIDIVRGGLDRADKRPG